MNCVYDLVPDLITVRAKRIRNGGKWWETEHDVGSLRAYIESLEDIADQQEQTFHSQKITMIGQFLHECEEILEFDEIVFLCLRLAGYTYPYMEKNIQSLVRKDSTMHRKVRQALTKIKEHHGKSKAELEELD